MSLSQLGFQRQKKFKTKYAVLSLKIRQNRGKTTMPSEFFKTIDECVIRGVR